MVITLVINIIRCCDLFSLVLLLSLSFTPSLSLSLAVSLSLRLLLPLPSFLAHPHPLHLSLFLSHFCLFFSLPATTSHLLLFWAVSLLRPPSPHGPPSPHPPFLPLPTLPPSFSLCQQRGGLSGDTGSPICRVLIRQRRGIRSRKRKRETHTHQKPTGRQAGRGPNLPRRSLSRSPSPASCHQPPPSPHSPHGRGVALRAGPACFVCLSVRHFTDSPWL